MSLSLFIYLHVYWSIFSAIRRQFKGRANLQQGTDPKKRGQEEQNNKYKERRERKGKERKEKTYLPKSTKAEYISQSRTDSNTMIAWIYIYLHHSCLKLPILTKGKGKVSYISFIAQTQQISRHKIAPSMQFGSQWPVRHKTRYWRR